MLEELYDIYLEPKNRRSNNFKTTVATIFRTNDGRKNWETDSTEGGGPEE